MKTFAKLIYIGACLSLLFSCQKSDEFNDELQGNDLKSGHKKGAVITVTPNGSDDTENLLQAFADAAVAGPGTTIKLVEGEYFVGYMEVYNFQGSLVGAGREKTTITLIPVIDVQAQYNNNQTDGWWRMIGGDICITDMTFKTPDGILIDGNNNNPYNGLDLYSIFMFNNYNDLYYFPENPQKVCFNRVNFFGGYDNPDDGGAYWKTDHSVLLAIWIGMDYYWPAPGIDYPLTKGNFVIKNCYFEHFIDGAEGFSLGEDAEMEVTSCSFNKCLAPLYFTANYNSKISILNNAFSNTSVTGDVFIEDTDWDWMFQTTVEPIRRCRYIISGNVFNAANPIPSLITKDHWVYIDSEKRLPMLIEITNNKFNLVEGGMGISLNNSQDAVVKNNHLKGDCSIGIAVDGFTWLDPDNIPYAKNVLFLGNNFSKLNSSVANIYLGEKTMDCTVVGSKTDGKVVDEGVNNKIVGMQKGKPGHHVGPMIKDNFRLMRQFKK